MKIKQCSKCQRILPFSNFGIHSREKDGLQYQCKDCDKKYRENQYKIKSRQILDRNKRLLDKYPWRRTLFSIKQRCTNINNPKYYRYGGRGVKCLITEAELKFLWFRDCAYEMKKPSIDRIDNDGNYCIENCRYIEIGENSLKMNLKINAKAVVQIDKKGNVVNEFISMSDATRQTHINNISKVIRGLCKTAGKYYWKIKE